jgi:3-hydroxyisobutyrate dehydrogenase-like beta-hydroxyacid dehydrogenase
MEIPVIGFIGFGEAAYLISKGLLKDGIKKIVVFDILTNDEKLGSIIQERAKELHVDLVSSLAEVIEKSRIIFCATSAKVAEKIAKEVSMLLNPHQIYVDLNAASPMVKEKISSLVDVSQAKFVDGAVMEPVPLKKHKVPIFLSGNGAKLLQNYLTPFGMNLTFISESPGSSSSIKMIRSIFMKGFTMLLLETLEASHRYGVTSLIMESIGESINQRSLEETANMLINRTAIHAERRVSEMGEVIQTLGNLDLDSTLSKAVKNKLQRIVDLNLKAFFNNEVPEYYEDVLKALEELD